MSLDEDKVVNILRDIAESVKNGEASDQANRRESAALKGEMIKLNENQTFLQKSIEEALLNFQRTEDRAIRSDKMAEANAKAVTEIRHLLSANSKAFVESTGEINRLRLEWENREKQWGYRLQLIEEESLPRLYRELDERISYEEFKDYRQDAEIAEGKVKIQEYESMKDQAKAFIKKFGLLIGAAAWPVISVIKDAVDWGAIWEWIVDLL